MRIYFTVDVECSLPVDKNGQRTSPLGTEKRVYGKMRGKYYGIPLIMDTLDEYGFKGSFFCDVCMRYLVGDDEASGVIKYISSRGHDVQLHIHPIYKFWAYDRKNPILTRAQWSDNIGDLPQTLQNDLLLEGKKFIFEHTGKYPVAFRAGNYGAADTTLELLSKNGFLIDSSYCIWAKHAPGYKCNINTQEKMNTPFRKSGIYEFPVTTLVSNLGMKQYRLFAPESSSYAEMRSALSKLKKAGVTDVVFILHSFSFVRFKGENHDEIEFNNLTYKRFKKILAYISRHNKEYSVKPLNEIHENMNFDVPGIGNNKNFVVVPKWMAFLRYLGQAKQRFL